ncbi:MAG: hypothetical protein HC932_03105 [Thermales bacterium]|nr:hypothetical protein [Thermales bacterium]
MYNPDITQNQSSSKEKISMISRIRKSVQEKLQLFVQEMIKNSEEVFEPHSKEEVISSVKEFTDRTFESTEPPYPTSFDNINHYSSVSDTINDVIRYAKNSKNQKVFKAFQSLLGRSKIPGNEDFKRVLKDQIYLIVNDMDTNRAIDQNMLINFLLLLEEVNKDLQNKKNV